MQWKNNRPIPKITREKIKERSGNQCEYTDGKGRCIRNTGLSIHHLKERSNGGSNALSNLLHVCGFHRRLLHKEYDKGGKRCKNTYKINNNIEITEFVKEKIINE